jgi:hypothetical protein
VLSGSVSEPGSKKTRSSTRLLSSKNNSFVKQMIRPATVHGLVENCKLLENLSERCVTLAKSIEIDADANLNVEKNDAKVLADGEELRRKSDIVLESVDANEICGQAGGKPESKSSLRRQEVIDEFEDGEKFLMRMKIHCMTVDQKVREVDIKVNGTGSDIVIKCT